MNYFEFYGGDYLRDTTRLSLTDHGAFLRLLIAYYAEEEPLPATHAELFVIAGATSANDKAAVRRVADKYFPIAADGLRHNGRADEEIDKAQGRMEGGEESKSNNADRQRRYRERRQKLFDVLRQHGITRPFDTKMADLESEVMELASRNADRNAERNEPRNTVTQQERHVTPLPTATTRHTPDPTNPPCGNNHTPPAAPAVSGGHVDYEGTFEGHVAPVKPTPNPVAAFAIALTRAGASCTSMNPDLIAFVAEGGKADELAALARTDGFVGKPANYVIKAARRMLAEVAQPITGDTNHANGSRGGARRVPSLADRSAEAHDDGGRAGGQPEPEAPGVLIGEAVRVR